MLRQVQHLRHCCATSSDAKFFSTRCWRERQQPWAAALSGVAPVALHEAVTSHYYAQPVAMARRRRGKIYDSTPLAFLGFFKAVTNI